MSRYLGARPEHQVVFITQRKDAELPGREENLLQASTHHHPAGPSLPARIRSRGAQRAGGCPHRPGASQIRIHSRCHARSQRLGRDMVLEGHLSGSPPHRLLRILLSAAGRRCGLRPADPITPDTAPRLRTKNLGNLLALDTADLGQCPTEWQKSVYPRRYQTILNVIHEGIDTIIPNPTAPPGYRSSIRRVRNSWRAMKSSPTWHVISNLIGDFQASCAPCQGYSPPALRPESSSWGETRSVMAQNRPPDKLFGRECSPSSMARWT